VLYPHQELLLMSELGIDGVPVHSDAGPYMVGGLDRIAAAARAVSSGEVDRAVAHATSGPCLQQNLVAVLAGESAS
jgi:hypothetical protein